jgi:hypothetical protein
MVNKNKLNKLKTKIMKALLIDSKNKVVKQIEIGEHFTEISKAIDCETFSAPHILENEDTMYCDDEGLLKNPQHFFLLDTYPQPIAGNGLILGCDDEGDSIDVKTTLDELISRVTFMNIDDAYNWSLKQSYQFN